MIPLGQGGCEGAGKHNWTPPFQLSGIPDVFGRGHRRGHRMSPGRLAPGESERLARLLSEKGVNLAGIHGTEQHRLRPSSASENSFRWMSVPGCRPPIHSGIAHESRTRVFTLALLPLEGPEVLHQVAAGPGSSSFLQAGSFDTSIVPGHSESGFRGFGMAI